MRRRFLDVRRSTIPQIVGTIAGDLPTMVGYVNTAQERLILCGGDRGWWGSWYKTVWNVTTANPYITCGREIARITDLAVCGVSVKIQNEFYEFLEAGIGMQPNSYCGYTQCGEPIQTFERGMVSTMIDIPSTGKYLLRLYLKDPRDIGKRVLISGLDQNGMVIRNTDGVNEVAGEYLVLSGPFVESISEFTKITGIQRDVTFRDVDLYAWETTTGVETLLSTYAPDEEVPVYRRYYISNMPLGCCCSTSGTVQVIGMAKLEFIPVRQDTDFLIIGNIPALEEEIKSIWFGRMDDPKLFGLSIAKHRNALHFLNEEIKHYQGTTRPAIHNPIFGTATLENQRIGSVI
jgi:hypothetical protein